MQLSDELFADFRRSLGFPDVENVDAEGRRTTRVEGEARVEIEAFGRIGAKRRTVTLADLGARGLAILDDRPWGAGDRFIIHLPRANRTVVPLVCTVRNSKLKGSLFRIGAEFTDQAELMADGGLVLGANGVANGPNLSSCTPESQAGRRSPRQRVDIAHAFGQVHGQKGSSRDVREVEVVDLSSDGVGIITQSEMKVGDHAMIRLCPPGGRTITRMFRVANCRPLEGGSFRVGGQFVHRPAMLRIPQMLFGWFHRGDGATG